MYCPQCGKQQSSKNTRFCANCGMSYEEAAKLLTADTNMPVYFASNTRKNQLSPRAKGILQGVALIPVLIGLCFILVIIYDQFDVGVMDGAYAVFTLILLIGLTRMAYAVFFEEGGKGKRTESASSEWQRKMPVSAPQTSLPESSTTFASEFEIKGHRTGESVQPRSVVENTTGRLSEIK